MRIPHSNFHEIVFQLVRYLNAGVGDPRRIELIPYLLSAPGNDLYINHHRSQVQAMSATPATVCWDVPLEYKNVSAYELLEGAIGPLIRGLENPDEFEEKFLDIVKRFDNFSFRFYCTLLGWPDSVIDFVETVVSQTNQFSLSVPELVMQSMDFYTKEWKTIKGGMSRLPQAMAHMVGYENITLGARVTGFKDEGEKGVTVWASGYGGTIKAIYDRVVLAIPPAALRMIVSRPHWWRGKEIAIRSMHSEPLYKMGLRFKTRFWERVQPSSKGGQTTSDLPIRWIVFPSNGIGDDGPGVLLVYAW